MRPSRATRAMRAPVRAGLKRLGLYAFFAPGAHSDTVVAAYPPDGRRPREAARNDCANEHGVVLSGGQAELAGKIVRFGTMGEIARPTSQARRIELALMEMDVARTGCATGAAIESLSGAL